jgi:shikimate kinase
VKPVVLVGFMGCGKSTVGRALSVRLCRAFVDTDELLVERYGPIQQQFADEGESVFRKREAEVLREALAEDVVVAVGGGAFVHECAEELLRGTTTVFLDVPLAVLDRRLREAGTERPLWNAQAGALLEARYPVYRRATHIVDGDASVDEVVQRVLEVL